MPSAKQQVQYLMPVRTAALIFVALSTPKSPFQGLFSFYLITRVRKQIAATRQETKELHNLL